MELSALTALSPIDGRYHAQTSELHPIFSEYGLIRKRLIVEVRWLQALSEEPAIPEVGLFTDKTNQFLQGLIDNFSIQDALDIKAIERTTNHDVKAVEYWLKEKTKNHGVLAKINEFIHFACTSEDINSLCHALMLNQARTQIILPSYHQLIDRLQSMAKQYAHTPMLARTHGQVATPTTLGKELMVFAHRLSCQQEQLAAVNVLGKMNGASGNWNAHIAAYPQVDWPTVSGRLIRSLGIEVSQLTTQIEPHDYIAQYLHCLSRFNTVLLDLCRDIWWYIAMGYFQQALNKAEVGSSTMPHKINPIDFENAEGNIGIANALSTHLAAKLPVSRLQRDLSDSTVLRNLGVIVAYSLIAWQSALRGLSKIQADEPCLTNDIQQHWEVLAEPIQIIMKRHGIKNAYEQLKAITRNQQVNAQMLNQWIDTLQLPNEVKSQLKALNPADYLGNAPAQTKKSWQV